MKWIPNFISQATNLTDPYLIPYRRHWHKLSFITPLCLFLAAVLGVLTALSSSHTSAHRPGFVVQHPHLERGNDPSACRCAAPQSSIPHTYASVISWGTHRRWKPKTTLIHQSVWSSMDTSKTNRDLIWLSLVLVNTVWTAKTQEWLRDKYWETSWTRAAKTEWKKRASAERRDSFEPCTLPFHLQFLSLSPSHFQTVTPSSLLFSFHPSSRKCTGWRFSSACRSPSSRSQIYMEKERSHARHPALLFPKPRSVSNTECSLVGQQGNTTHGTHYDFLIEASRKTQYPSYPPNFPSDSEELFKATVRCGKTFRTGSLPSF